jgi:hypothetical protein
VKARSFVRLFILGVAVAAPLTACDDDHDHDHDDGAAGEHGHDEMPASCEAFHDDCVRVMQTNAKAAECDEFSHGEGRTEEECATKKDECVAACADAGTP